MPIKVLIVEENPDEQTCLKGIFPKAGFEIDCVSDSVKALALLNEEKKGYMMIVASENSLGDEPETFSLSLRTNKHYIHTPLILITPESTHTNATYYAVGFTQVYSKLELANFKHYVDQRLQQRFYAKQYSHKVILIEDDRSQQLIINAILDDNHCTISSYRSAEEALEHTGDSPDIILVDFFLAGRMTGMEFITEVKSPFHPWFKVPILALTGIDDAARKYECLRAGASDYLVKPLESIDLSVRVENLIKYKHLLDTVDKQSQEMLHLAMHDQLTGLNNRHYMVSHTSKRIKEAIRHSIPLSIIMLDIDHFKKVNDSLGHDIGDKVLQEVAGILKKQSRDEDIVIRLGGEEFLMVLGYCDLESALLKADILRQCIENSELGGTHVTASFGVVTLSQDLNGFEKMFKSADDAVYRAKEKGRNRVEKGVEQGDGNPTLGCQ